MSDQQVTISFYAPVQLRERLDKWAEKDHRSRSSLLCHILEPLVEEREVVVLKEQASPALQAVEEG